jgi:hypothetical protein
VDRGTGAQHRRGGDRRAASRSLSGCGPRGTGSNGQCAGMSSAERPSRSRWSVSWEASDIDSTPSAAWCGPNPEEHTVRCAMPMAPVSRRTVQSRTLSHDDRMAPAPPSASARRGGVDSSGPDQPVARTESGTPVRASTVTRDYAVGRSPLHGEGRHPTHDDGRQRCPGIRISTTSPDCSNSL